MNREEFMKDMLNMQIKWKNYLKNKTLTKKKLIELCKPFRDKYNLSDKQTLCIARDELSKEDLLEILEGENNAKD